MWSSVGIIHASDCEHDKWYVDLVNLCLVYLGVSVGGVMRWKRTYLTAYTYWYSLGVCLRPTDAVLYFVPSESHIAGILFPDNSPLVMNGGRGPKIYDKLNSPHVLSPIYRGR